MTGTSGMATTQRHTVVGAFDGPDAAERALNGLKAAGFTPEQVSVVAKDQTDTQELAGRTEMAGEGVAAGAVTGGVLGGLVGFLIGISALVIPGIGPIVGAGILLSTLAGAGIGAATGGLVGALAEHGVPEADARGYEAHVGAGRLLLTAHANDEMQAQAAHRAFNDAGGADVRGYGVAA
jgi:uncharacterized membrane protein